jgi:hypothetical protein
MPERYAYLRRPDWSGDLEAPLDAHFRMNQWAGEDLLQTSPPCAPMGARGLDSAPAHLELTNMGGGASPSRPPSGAPLPAAPAPPSLQPNARMSATEAPYGQCPFEVSPETEGPRSVSGPCAGTGATRQKTRYDAGTNQTSASRSMEPSGEKSGLEVPRYGPVAFAHPGTIHHMAAQGAESLLRAVSSSSSAPERGLPLLNLHMRGGLRTWEPQRKTSRGTARTWPGC